ncbi:MAG TPA: uracil-DNA glycosylase [Bryobacteraceae bacterium]|nr:uracil-DNA glycosylase [Bryobacteraceae bacterium]
MNPELLRQYLEYYQDLGVKTLYRRAAPGVAAPEVPAPAVDQPAAAPAVEQLALAAPAAERPAAPSVLLAQIRADIGDCRRCPLHAQRTQIVFGVGNEEAKLVFVGEGPGADEDAQGIPFVGRAGQLLTQMIDGTARREGMPIRRPDVYICNVVKCRPPNNRTPEPEEMEICGQFLFRQLEAIRPKAICALGGTAARALLNRREGVTRLRGNWFRWRDIPVMVTYHPSYLLRPYNQNAKREAWEDLKKVLHYVYD